jgi:CheY-like chemotaxis protein
VGRRVLVVDDDAGVRDALGELLQLCGHEVNVAADGLAAVEAACRGRPDVVVLDLGIPGIDGLEVARRIRAELGSAPLLVAVTGAVRPEDEASARAAGCDRFLAKPVDVDALEALVGGAPGA